MKKFAVMMPPTFVFAEDGKNGLCGPPPSAFIVEGGTEGFWMRCRACRLRSTAGLAAAARRISPTTDVARTTAAVLRGDRETDHAARSKSPPTPDSTCAFTAA